MFLVLGDPGSGKSTALRKVAKEMLAEVKYTGRIPIYVNLKEWKSKEKWDKENLPTPQDLLNFIFGTLKRSKDVLAKRFLNEYFVKMYEHGRLFFLLDSFDEIPQILDSKQSSYIIDELSNLIYNFLAGAAETRGILASRHYRKPTKKFKAKTIFEIRPYTELKIEQTFSRGISGIPKSFLSIFLKIIQNWYLSQVTLS